MAADAPPPSLQIIISNTKTDAARNEIQSVIARKLHRFEYHIIEDTKYDPELVGKYHTDAFNTLKEKYENSISGSSTSSEVMKDMKEILTDYCPSNDANPMNACMNTISEYAEKNHDYKIHGRLLKSVFSEDKLQILEDAITSMDNRKDALEAIRSLKEGLDQNDTKERAVVAALSVAEE